MGTALNWYLPRMVKLTFQGLTNPCGLGKGVGSYPAFLPN